MRSLSSTGNGHRQRYSVTAAPLPLPVTAAMLMMKIRFPWVPTVSKNQIGRDSVNEVFNNHGNMEEIVKEMRVVGRKTALKTEGNILKFRSQGQNFRRARHSASTYKTVNAKLTKETESFPHQKKICQGFTPPDKPAMMI